MISLIPMHPALYRSYQFFAALKAYLPAWAGGLAQQPSAEDRALLHSVLPVEAQQRLFARMSPNDQRHGLAVTRTLQQAGYQQPALLQAALLHDVAKSLGQPILHRVLIVLLAAFWPAALRWLSHEREGAAPQVAQVEAWLAETSWLSRWRRPFVIHAYHPVIGAAWAETAGCDPVALKLILKHQASIEAEPLPDRALLAALQWADNLN
jgi:hypothetical protein